MDEERKIETGADMWRDYAARYGAITARISCRRYLNMQADTADPEEQVFCQQLREEIAMARNFKDAAVYLHNEKLAALNGELNLYNESNRLNRLCAGDIDAAVSACEYGDGTHDLEYAVAALSDYYGLERVKLVLAAEAKWLGFAGRIPKEFYWWTRSFDLGEHFYGGFHLHTRPAVLGELISEIRREENNMDKLPSKETVARLRKQYPEGSQVELVSMNDPHTNLKSGDKGTVEFVDDTGTIFVAWDNGSGLGLVYGVDSCRKIENEITKSGNADHTVTSTLGELIEKMESQNKIDQTIMRECISGLGTYAAHKAKENSFASEIKKTRELIKRMVPYWGLDDGGDTKQLDDFLTAFDEEVHEALFAKVVSDDTFRACGNIIIGLYRYGRELADTQGSDAMGEILDMSDLIRDVSEYFKFEENSPSKIDVTSEMVNNLRTEVKDMLEYYTLPGQAVNGGNVHGYTVKQAVLFSNDSGFAFAHNPLAASPFVTWQMFNDNGKLSYETGNYYSTEEKALVDFISRSGNYKDTYKLAEKPLPEPPALELLPEKKLIRFIDSEYRELFQIPDGESVKITYPPGDNRGTITRECKYHDEYHFSVKGGDMYHICQFAEIMERLGAKYEPATQLQDVTLIPFTIGEDKFYLPNRDAVNTSAGIISGDFKNGGERYHAYWTKKGGGDYTPEMQSELQSVIYALRQSLLKDRNSMLAYCENHPEAKLPESGGYNICGFKLETETRQYFIRCFAEQDSHFAIYAYTDKPTPSIELVVAQSPERPEGCFSFGEIQPGYADGKTASAIEQARDGKTAAKENGGYTSVLKTIEDGKKAQKPPRKIKTPKLTKNKKEEL